MRLNAAPAIIDQTAAQEACRLLINSVCDSPDVPCDEQVGVAIKKALQAFGLTEDFPMRVFISQLDTDLVPHND